MEKTNHKSDKMIKEYLQASMSTGGRVGGVSQWSINDSLNTLKG
jgi:hypothetical protein